MLTTKAFSTRSEACWSGTWKWGAMFSRRAASRMMPSVMRFGSMELIRMRRSYRIADYQAVIERIVAAIPDAAIGADVMVGFPGETEDDFRQLVEALTTLPLTYHHVFRYSEREGTAASRMTAAVDPAVRKERSCVLREISRKRRLEVARRSIGQTRLVHFEHPNGDGYWEGLTDNYLRVRVPITATLDDPFQPVRLTRYNDSTLFGRLSRPVGIATRAS